MFFPHPRALRVGLLTVILSASCGFGAALFDTPYINPKDYNIEAVIPPPPKPGSMEYKLDSGFLKDVLASSTKEQFDKGMQASNDGVFDYSKSLGNWFCSRNLPKTTKLFDKVTTETKQAIELAKNHFGRERPKTWKATGDNEKSEGYSYPSGHTTRAFVWAILLSDSFPDMKEALHLQARQKAWYRVILGRHFPDDVHAGKVYGKFLAEQFLKSPSFQKDWLAVVEEMRAARSKSTKQLFAPQDTKAPPPSVSASANH